MIVRDTALPGVRIFEPTVWRDSRGSFRETWRASSYEPLIGATFAQDNVSITGRGIVRGLHFQHPEGQGKLVTVLRGAAYDVAVDVRRGSRTFGKWVGVTLSGENGWQLWIPAGFAHGFQALLDETVLLYKVTSEWAPACERAVHYADAALAIAWPLPVAGVAPRDAAAPGLAAAPADWLPTA